MTLPSCAQNSAPMTARSEIGRYAVEFGTVENRHVETELLLSLLLLREEIELALVLGDHQSAAHFHLAIGAELLLERRPIGDSKLVEVERLFEVGTRCGKRSRNTLCICTCKLPAFAVVPPT